jgi:uncharacterized membrane protein YjgN (DUF898 family)
LFAAFATAAGRIVHQLPKSADPQQTQLIAALVFVPGVVVVLFALKLTGAWFDAALVRQVLANLRYGDLRFATGITGRRLFRLRLGNLLIRIATLGLGQPFIVQRCARFVQAHVQVLGTLDVEALRQTTLWAPKRGEGLLEALDVGIAG